MESSIIIPTNTSINKNSIKIKPQSEEEINNILEQQESQKTIVNEEIQTLHLSQLYEQTSQYKHWIFTKEELEEIRERVNKEAIEEVDKNIKKEWEYQRELNNGKIAPLQPIDYMTAKDQKTLALFYETKIFDYCRVFKFSRNILATSIVYFKRFFLYCSMMYYTPKNIVLTCLFLACKSENSYIALEDFLKKVPKGPSAEIIRELELVVSQNIRFEFLIQSPFWPLHGFFLDIQAFLSGPDNEIINSEDNSQRRLQATFKGSYDYASISLYGDLIFLYWPSQIALACLMIASKSTGFTEDLESYIENILKDQTTEKIESLRKNLSEIEKAILQYTKIEKSVAIAIERKRQHCQNPAFNTNSILHKKRKEMEKTEQEMKRQKKIKSMQQQDESDELFMTGNNNI